MLTHANEIESTNEVSAVVDGFSFKMHSKKSDMLVQMPKSLRGSADSNPVRAINSKFKSIQILTGCVINSKIALQKMN